MPYILMVTQATVAGIPRPPRSVVELTDAAAEAEIAAGRAVPCPEDLIPPPPPPAEPDAEEG